MGTGSDENEPVGPLPQDRVRPMLAGVSRTELLIAIIGLIFLEVCHLKWIIWEYWNCGRCRVKNRQCGCKSKWMLYL